MDESLDAAMLFTIIGIVVITYFYLDYLRSVPDHAGAPCPSCVYDAPRSEQNESDRFIDAASDALKLKLNYLKRHDPKTYNNIKRNWMLQQDSRNLDPFDAAAAVEKSWDECYQGGGMEGWGWEC